MSWSFNAAGKPADLVAALRAESERLTGNSKSEFDEALPHLIGLIELNSCEHPDQRIDLEANGHAVFADGKKSSSNCSVNISSFYKRILSMILLLLGLLTTSPAIAQLPDLPEPATQITLDDDAFVSLESLAYPIEADLPEDGCDCEDDSSLQRNDAPLVSVLIETKAHPTVSGEDFLVQCEGGVCLGRPARAARVRSVARAPVVYLSPRSNYQGPVRRVGSRLRPRNWRVFGGGC